MPSAVAGRFAGDLFTQSPKHPPYWGPELSERYPFRHWQRDVELWSAASDIPAERKGPLLAARLGGMARALAHTMPVALLQNGQHNPQEGRVVPGLEILLRGLAQRFAPFTAESSSKSMMEFLGFRRAHGESIDEAISRWELLQVRAEDLARFNISTQGATLLLFIALGMPKQTWWHHFAPFNGDFPQDRAQLTLLLDKLRQ